MNMQNDCMARVGELNLLLRALPNNANGVNDFSCDSIGVEFGNFNFDCA